MRAPLSLLVLAVLSAPAVAVEIDGRIDAAEWQGARHVTDFRKVQPLSREPGTLSTEAWVLATPDGLAIAFRNLQPPQTRTRQKVQRDFEEQVDRVNLMVDFDGDGRTGYDFTVASTGGVADAVISNENQFNDDWDGQWQHAVSEDEAGWNVELLIPWYTAPMRNGRDGMRTIRVYLDRVIGSTGERSAWPAASFELPRFLSDFSPLEIPQYSQSLLAITPYASGLYDNVAHKSEFDGGADIFWKPNGQFQLTATLNPDFGQVESDDLVINFSATETFISDKRPFFTENQGIFEFTTPSDFSQLLYTRRVGAPTDDRSGEAGDITGAVKLNGSIGATKYGVFAAEEADEVGRTFAALRLVRDFSEQNLGAMLTRVERPFLDREATVGGIDQNWRPTERLSLQTRLIGSQIDQSGETTRDSGFTTWIKYEMDGGWRQEWIGMHFGSELQINDFGYLSRNSTNYGHWELRRRFTDLPDSRYSSKEWRGGARAPDNDHRERLADQFRISRQAGVRDGSSEYMQLNVNSAGVNDLLTRGHGSVNLPPYFNSVYEYNRPRKGDWGFDLVADVFSGGLAGNDKVGFDVEITPTYFISDAFSVYAGAYYQRIPSWLVWQRENLIGEFDEHWLQFNAGLDWIMTERHELRVKLQAIGLNAPLSQGYRVDASGNAIATNEPVDDFSVRNLGFQIRYRYELAPLSYLYVVYGRGGYRQEPFSEEPRELLRDSLELRDDEQLLVKLSYRFEI
jgi:hypothetical protein